MILGVSLAGHMAAWRFRGTPKYKAWLDAAPWFDQGSLLILRVSESADLKEIEDQLNIDMAQVSHGRGAVFTESPSLTNVTRLSAELLDAFCGCLGIDHPHPASRRQALADSLSRNPRHVFVAQVETGMLPPLKPAYYDAQKTIQSLNADASLTVVLIARGLPQTEDVDLRHGAPAAGLFDVDTPTQRTLWGSYAHRRLAWEYAGDYALAKFAVGDYVAGAVTAVSDSALEDRLNLGARNAFGALSPDATVEIDEFLRNDEKNVRHALRTRGFLWSPMSSSETLAPWICRALLLLKRHREYAGYFRAQLVCMPIASELLERCFALELYERARIKEIRSEPVISDSEPMKRARDRHHLFENNDTEGERRYYPKDFPHLELDVTDFLTFNEYIRAYRLNSHKGLRMLGRLRNALAHGHYVSWQSVCDLLEATADLKAGGHLTKQVLYS